MSEGCEGCKLLRKQLAASDEIVARDWRGRRLYFPTVPMATAAAEAIARDDARIMRSIDEHARQAQKGPKT